MTQRPEMRSLRLQVNYQSTERSISRHSSDITQTNSKFQVPNPKPQAENRPTEIGSPSLFPLLPGRSRSSMYTCLSVCVLRTRFALNLLVSFPF